VDINFNVWHNILFIRLIDILTNPNIMPNIKNTKKPKATPAKGNLPPDLSGGSGKPKIELEKRPP
jgi:hypothetical protein